MNTFLAFIQGRFLGINGNLKKYAFLPLLLLVGCAGSPQMEGNVHAQPLGDLIKCADSKNQHLPTCYCHNTALKKNPGREEICTASLDSWLRDELEHSRPRSREFIRDLRNATAQLEKFQREEIETWTDTTASYLAGSEINDDCDAVDSLLDIAFALGEFRLDELAKVLVDSNPHDSIPADHYVAAVWVEGEWMMLDYFVNDAQPLVYLEFGGYETKTGNLATESKVIAYRRLSHSKWREGLPPRVMEEVQFIVGL